MLTLKVVVSSLVPLELGHRGELAAGLLDDGIGGVVARAAALRHVLASHELRQETAL